MTRPGNLANPYSFGAGRVRLAPGLPATRPNQRDSLARELLFLFREGGSGGPAAVWSRFARGATWLLALALLVPAVVNRVLIQSDNDESELRIVAFESVAPQPRTEPPPAASVSKPEARPETPVKPALPAPPKRARPPASARTPGSPAKTPVSSPHFRLDALAQLPKISVPSAPPPRRPRRPDRLAPANSGALPRLRIDQLDTRNSASDTASVRGRDTLRVVARATPTLPTRTSPASLGLEPLPTVSTPAESAGQHMRERGNHTRAKESLHRVTLNGVPLAALASCVSDREEELACVARN